MAARRRDSRPPYEIMTRGMRAAGGASDAPQDAKDAGGDDTASPDPTAGTWLARANAPILLRVPRGYAVLAGVGLLVLIIAAYGVGVVRGYHKAQQVAARERDAYRSPLMDGELGRDLTTIAEFRRPQHHYVLIDSRYDETDARRLVGFLVSQGIDAAAIMPYNGTSFYVVAKRAFALDQLNSPAYREFERQVTRLGPIWRDQYRGSDFSRAGVSALEYDGHAAKKIIGKGTES